MCLANTFSVNSLGLHVDWLYTKITTVKRARMIYQCSYVLLGTHWTCANCTSNHLCRFLEWNFVIFFFFTLCCFVILATQDVLVANLKSFGGPYLVLCCTDRAPLGLKQECAVHQTKFHVCLGYANKSCPLHLPAPAQGQNCNFLGIIPKL